MKLLKFKTHLRSFNIRNFIHGMIACTYANSVKKGKGEMDLSVEELKDGRIKINLLVTPNPGDEESRKILRRKVELNIERMTQDQTLNSI